MKRIGDLEIDENLDFQKKQWQVQRVAWVAMVLLIILALVGLFGTGPLSSATTGDMADGMNATYQRFVRHGGKESVTFEVNPEQVRDGQVQIWLSTAFLDQIDIQQITPQPDEVHGTGEHQVYVFLMDDPQEPVSVMFSFRPEAIGPLSVDAGVVDGPELSFTQFAYP